MKKPEAFYLEMLEQQLETLLHRVQAGLPADQRLNAEEFDMVLRETRQRLRDSFRDKRYPQFEHARFLQFVRKLMGRQGTQAPDFDSLYQRKAELDQKFNEPRGE